LPYAYSVIWLEGNAVVNKMDFTVGIPVKRLDSCGLEGVVVISDSCFLMADYVEGKTHEGHKNILY